MQLSDLLQLKCPHQVVEPGLWTGGLMALSKKRVRRPRSTYAFTSTRFPPDAAEA